MMMIFWLPSMRMRKEMTSSSGKAMRKTRVFTMTRPCLRVNHNSPLARLSVAVARKLRSQLQPSPSQSFGRADLRLKTQEVAKQTLQASAQEAEKRNPSLAPSQGTMVGGLRLGPSEVWVESMMRMTMARKRSTKVTPPAIDLTFL